MPMRSFLPDETLQAIAAENNLAETAFFVPEGSDYRLRWFTPTVEVPLCGHATLATAAVVMERLETARTGVVFQSASGPLTVHREGSCYVMQFPALNGQPVAAPAGMAEALRAVPLEVLENPFNYMALLPSAKMVRELSPDFAGIARLDRSGVVVTAAGEGGYDCVSRYFAPAKGIPEDPVTGSAHCMLAPFWAQRLHKKELRAFQASRRGGEVICRMTDEGVELEGSCVFYMEGEVEI
jgi:PhzF family phenazine biosynthesis protein